MSAESGDRSEPPDSPASPELLRLLFQAQKVLPTIDMAALREHELKALNDAFGACATAIDEAADQCVRNRLNDTVFDVFFDRELVDGGADD